MATMQQLEAALDKTDKLIGLMKSDCEDSDEVIGLCNGICKDLGGDPLPWSNFEEFDEFMMSDKTLVL